MRPYLHDVRRTLSGGVAVAVVVLGVLGGLLAYGTVSEYPPPTTLNGAGYYSYEDGNYRIVLFAFGLAAEPIRDLSVALTVTVMPNNTSAPPPAGQTFFASTDAQGRMEFDLAIAEGNYDAFLSVPSSPGASPNSGPQGALLGFSLTNLTAGAVEVLDPITVVATSLYSAYGALEIVDAGPGGSLPLGATVAECTYVLGPTGESPNNCTPLDPRTIATLSAYVTEVAPFTGPSGSTALVELLDPNGTIIATFSYSGANVVSSPVPSQPQLLVDTPGPGMLTTFAGIAPLLLAVAGFLVPYATYARPRLSGFLEPVLVRPVTRTGLLLSRYAATVVLLAALSGAVVAVFDVCATSALGAPVPAGDLAALAAAFFVSGAAIAGFVVLAAHLFRTPGGPLGVGLGLVVVLGLFWSTLLNVVVGLFSRSAGFYATQVLLLHLELLSPVLLPAIAANFATGTATYGGVGAFYAYAGVTPALVVALAVAWVVPSVLIAYAWARRHD